MMDPKPIILTGHQRTLHSALGALEPRLAAMYQGALQVLAQLENPDRLALAAHNLREVMRHFPRYIALPDTAERARIDSPHMKSKALNLLDDWDRTKRNTQCCQDGKWSGEIDTHARKILEKVEAFLQWVREERGKNTEEVGRFLRQLDPRHALLPSPIEELRMQEWKGCWDYFVGLAHHNGGGSAEEFRSWQWVLENFLLDRLVPRTFEDHAALDAIIEEGEAHAE